MGLSAAVLLIVATATPPRIGMSPLHSQGLEEQQRVFYEDQLRLVLRRYGLPVETVDETRAGFGAEALEACTLREPAGCTGGQGTYAGIFVSDISLSEKGYSGQLAVVDPASGGLIAAETVSAPDARAFLDGCSTAGDRLAKRTADKLRLEIPADAPLRGAAVYPLVAGGVLIGTGAYFLFAAASDSNTVKSRSVSLTEAVNARDSGPTNLALGITLTSLGVISTVVGIVFYAPGAERKPLVRLSVDPLHQRLALSGALP